MWPHSRPSVSPPTLVALRGSADGSAPGEAAAAPPTLHPSLKTAGRFALNWSYLNAIASGTSAIDLGSLALRNLSDARQFAREYGYDVERPGVLDYLRRIQQEALGFVRESFLAPHQHGLLPSEVVCGDDPLQLLVLASQRVRRIDPPRLWACALLKVMHGLFYIDNNLKLRHFESQLVFRLLRVDESHVSELGGEPNCTAHPQKSFVRVPSWQCTSRPITGTQRTPVFFDT